MLDVGFQLEGGEGIRGGTVISGFSLEGNVRCYATIGLLLLGLVCLNVEINC